MHTFKYTGLNIHHNGDFSGDVIISFPVAESLDDPTARLVDVGTDHDHWEVVLPFAALEALVADKVRKRLISEVEDLSVEDLTHPIRLKVFSA